MKPPRRPPADPGRPSDRPAKRGADGPRPSTPGKGGPGHGAGGRGGTRFGGPRPAEPRQFETERGETPRGGQSRPRLERSANPADGARPDPQRRDDQRRDDKRGPARPQGDRSQDDRNRSAAPPLRRDDTTLRSPAKLRSPAGNAARPPDRPPAARFTERETRPAGPREAPGGSLWLYGLHAVAAALGNPARRLRRLLLTEEAEASVASRLNRSWPVGVERTERARLDLLLGAGAIHQGAALLVDPLAPPSLQSAVARPGPILVLDQVTDPRNVGAILRAAAAFGVAAVITQDRNAPEETGALAKAASGALEAVPFLRAVNIARTLIALRAAGFWVVGLDAGGGVLSGPALAERRVALVLGNEGDGLRRLTRDTCDEVSGIAMPGLALGNLASGGATAQLESLNVSAAAAVALYELARR